MLLLLAALKTAAPPHRTPPPVLLASQASKAKLISVNRLARRNYEVLELLEAGISLIGTEVKSLRAGQLQLRDGYCRIKEGECWLLNCHIAKHGTTGGYFNHEETRDRRLLLHKSQIRKLEKATEQAGLTIVPLRCYFNEDSRVKVQIGLARGKKTEDKRETIKARDQKRELARQLKNV
ncbi:hypothetical protein AB1Y20_017832 [Prymnesium parvum]|uniref:SsrA-binding protein n=1 Tax=Prymnesium parvum TaxID=97485 RepID=A0AB34JNM2_PRYPA